MKKRVLNILNRMLAAAAITAIFVVYSPQTANAFIFFNWMEINPSRDASLVLNHNSYFVGIGTDNFSVNDKGANDSLDIVSDKFLFAYKSEAEKKTTAKPLTNHAVIKEMIVPITAYSSTPDQTDDTPFITASNTLVRDGIVAANFLPFGTRIKIPGVFGDKIFVVEDRMNKRYWHKIDIWFPDRESALGFGLKILKIQILES